MNPDIHCKDCDQKFSHKSSLSRHRHKFCHVLKSKRELSCGENSPDGVMTKMYDLVKELKADLSTVNRPAEVVNIHNNTMNVTINQFGKEDLSGLVQLDLNRILYRTKLGLVQLMEHIHFREKSDRNKNIRVSDMKHEMVEYFDGDRWMYGWKGDILERVMGRGVGLMSDHFDSEHEILRNKWSRTMFDHVETWLDGMQNEKHECVVPATRDMYLMLCNHSHLPNVSNVMTHQNPPRLRRKSI